MMGNFLTGTSLGQSTAMPLLPKAKRRRYGKDDSVSQNMTRTE